MTPEQIANGEYPEDWEEQGWCCRECLMCGGCEVHDGCATDWRHITWFMRFTSPGEPACEATGTVSGRSGYVCALPVGHDDEWHQARGGEGWKDEQSTVA